MASSSRTDRPPRDRAAELVLAAGGVHLSLCLAVVTGSNLGWIPLSRAGALLFVNLNMLLAAAAAVAAAFRLRGSGGRCLYRGLLAAAVLLLGAEAAAMAVEFTAPSRALESLSLALTFASRGGLVLLLLALLARRSSLPGRSRALLLVGGVLFLAADLLYCLIETNGGPEIWPGELGFYAGYWLMALGATLRKEV